MLALVIDDMERVRGETHIIIRSAVDLDEIGKSPLWYEPVYEE